MAIVFPLWLLNGICSVRFAMGVKNVSQTNKRKITPAPIKLLQYIYSELYKSREKYADVWRS